MRIVYSVVEGNILTTERSILAYAHCISACPWTASRWLDNCLKITWYSLLFHILIMECYNQFADDIRWINGAQNNKILHLPHITLVCSTLQRLCILNKWHGVELGLCFTDRITKQWRTFDAGHTISSVVLLLQNIAEISPIYSDTFDLMQP